MANLADLRKYCLSLPGATEDIKWDVHLCFNVGGKMFLITAPDEVPISASFKTSDELFDELSQRKGFMPAPYMARNKWVRVDSIQAMGIAEWKKMIRLSYDLVFSKLTVKLKKEILKG